MIGAHVAHHSTLRLLRTGNRLRDPPKPSKLVPAAGTESATDAFGRSSAALSSTPAPAPAPAATHLQCSAPATPAAAARGAHHRAAARPLRPQRASSELTSRAAPAIPPARDDDYWSNLGDVLLALRRVRVVVIAGAPSSRPAMGEPCRDAPRRARTREAVLLPWERASKDVRHTLLRNNHRASPSPYPMPPQGFHPLRSLSSLTKTQYIPNETLQSAPGAARQASPRPATKARRAPRRPPLPGECSAGAQRRLLAARSTTAPTRWVWGVPPPRAQAVSVRSDGRALDEASRSSTSPGGATFPKVSRGRIRIEWRDTARAMRKSLKP